MWSQPTSSRTAAGGSYAGSLPGRDWELLVRLPGRVLAAALETRPEPPLVVDGLAGVAAIAAGRAAPSRLVREVVAAIYASHDGPAAEPGAGSAAVLAECAAAGRVLAQRIPSADAAGYRAWVLDAARAPARGTLDTPTMDDPIGAAHRCLLAECERALAG